MAAAPATHSASAGKGRIPEGFHTLTPYFTIKGARKFIEFVKAAFGAKELQVMSRDNGEVGHALLQIGSSRLMCGDWSGGADCGPATVSTMYVYVEDVDSQYKLALAAGGTSTMEPTDMFYGDRNAAVKDQWGNQWYIATEKERVPEEELNKRFKEMSAKRQASAEADEERKADKKHKTGAEHEHQWPEIKLHTNDAGYALGYCVVYVSDMDRSIKFYSDLFKFPLRGPKSEHWTEFNTGTTCLSLHSAEDKAGTASATNTKGSGWAAPSWFVKDLNKFHQHAVALHVPVVAEPKKQEWGGALAAYRDPDGLVFSVVESP